MKNFIYFFCAIFNFQGFCQQNNNFDIFPSEELSGIYSMDNFTPKLIKPITYETLYHLDDDGNADFTKDYYYNVKIENTFFCKLKVFLKENAVCIETKYKDKSSTLICFEFSMFNDKAGSINYHYSFTENSILRIFYLSTVKVYIIVDITIKYKGKNCILHLKPETI